METLRFILSFDKEVYEGESKVWYIVDPVKTPEISDLVSELIQKFRIDSSISVSVFINDVIVPKWLPCSIINPCKDFIKLCFVQANKNERKSEQSSVEDRKKIDTVNQNHHVTGNQKSRFPNTTPTHKDRYTNRSKVFVSPGNLKKTPKKESPVVNALKTAVEETVANSSPMNSGKGCKRATPNRSVSTDLASKNAVFKEQVAKLISQKVPSVTADKTSSSDSSSSDSDSGSDSDNPPKKLKVEVKRSVTSSSSSSESEVEVVAKNQPPAKVEKTVNENVIAGLIKENPVPSSDTDEESSESDKSESEKCIEKKKITKKVESESEEESDDSSENEAMAVEESECNKEAIKENADYSAYDNLVGTPRVSDKLAFKTLSLSEEYCPIISDYKEGVITEYNSSSQMVKFKLSPSFVEPIKRNGRFELNESVNLASEYLELNLKQLIEPKLIGS